MTTAYPEDAEEGLAPAPPVEVPQSAWSAAWGVALILGGLILLVWGIEGICAWMGVGV